MAKLTSHTLNSVDGTHAADVPVSVVRILEDGARDSIVKTATDNGGRLALDIVIAQEHEGAQYELVFATGGWFASRNLPREGPQIVTDIVVRFAMPDPNGQYHIPIIIGPNGYSTWWSS